MEVLKFSVCSFLLVFSICSINASPIQVNDVAKGISEFARDLYSQSVLENPGNVVVSPVSVANLLALLAQGSSGNTFDELRKALHLSGNKDVIADQLLDLRLQLRKNSGKASLPLLTQIYLQQAQQLNRHFQDVAAQKFFAGVDSINFAESEKSAQTINYFVEESTHGKIKNLIKSDQLDAGTRSVLDTAVYFKGNWENPFYSDFTGKADFYNSETEKVPVDFMYVNDVFNYANLEELGAEALELQFANSSISFVIVLPKQRMGLNAVERKLKTYDWAEITEKMRGSRFDLHVPKFKVEYEINLKDVLSNLGVNEIFSGSSELNEILKSSESLKVWDIVHKATFEIDEKGAEAAAGTGAVLVPMSLPRRMTVNHPFMYFIRDTQTNTIIFSGRIEKFQ